MAIADRELLFTGYRVSVWNDEEPEMNRADSCTVV